MIATPVQKFLDALSHNTGAAEKQSGKGWAACCPAHDDKSPSLSISEGSDGRVLIHCHCGCTVESICHAVGLKVADLMPNTSGHKRSNQPKSNTKPKSKSNGEIVATYDYRDESNNLLFQVVRLDPKDFRQRRPKSGREWHWSIKGVRVVPYRLPEFLAEPTRLVAIVEGEKDCDNLARIGVFATCNSGGAGHWTGEHAQFLQGRDVVVVADNDDAGRKHAFGVIQSLIGIANLVRFVELPGLGPKEDISDWLSKGGTREQFAAIVAQTPDCNAADFAPWPELDPFDNKHLSKFPTDTLPLKLREWVEAESHATQTPPDLAALLSLAVCSAAIAKKVVVEPRPGYREPTNIFVAILLEPGNRKSAVFTDALRPLRLLETTKVELATPAFAKARTERRQDEIRLKMLEKKAAEKSDLEARYQAGELAAKLEMEPEPVLPRLIVDDVTSEMLAIILEQQNGRIISASPEGGVFDLMAGQYSKSGMPQFGVYLMGHSGDDLVTDRVSRDSVRVEQPALTCAYAIQPQVIIGLADNTAFRGRGLLARFLYAAPESWIGQREIAPEPVSDAIRDNYTRLVACLANSNEELLLQLNENAQYIFEHWESEIEEMLGEGGSMEIMRDWGAKLAGATLRLTGVLHCVGHGNEKQVDGNTMLAAIDIAKFLVPHADKVLDLMSAKEDDSEEDAKYVLRWIVRHEIKEFTKRDAQQHGKRRFPQATDIDAPLEELARRGYIRKKPLLQSAGPGRPPSPSFEVNPEIFKREQVATIPQYSHKVLETPEAGDIGNIECAHRQDEDSDREQVTI